MGNASTNEYAARIMAGPRGNYPTGPDDRHFFDPPENISLAFGGRPWFHSVDCKAVHRIGLFLGLGWRLGEYVQKQLDDQRINGARVTARTVGYGMTEQLYDLFFVTFWQEHEEGQEPDNLAPVQYHIVKHLGPLTRAQLKPAYAEFLGEHAV